MSLEYAEHAAEVERVIDNIYNQKSDTTAERYAGTIRTFAKWCDTEESPINNPFAAAVVDIEDYLSHLDTDRDYAYSTINCHISALNAFYSSAKKLADGGRNVPDPRREFSGDSLNWENPAENASLPDMNYEGTKRAKALESRDYEDKLTTKQVEDLTDNAASPITRNACLIQVMYHGMLRRTEAANLKVSDIDTEERTITIRSVVAKNGNSRIVPYTRQLDNYLSTWLNIDRESYATAAESEYLFLSNHRNKLSERHIGDIINDAATNADLQEVLFETANGRDIHRVTGHSLRRSGATRRWDAGCDIYTLKEWLGHESVDTTKTYINADKSELIDKNRHHW